MSRRVPLLALLAICLPTVAALAAGAARRGVWFCGDFETGGLQGWTWDRARQDSIEVVTQPVRKGRYAVRFTLAPGDIAARKERAELKVGDKEIERVHGSHGHEMWYGWSLLVPNGYEHPPGGQFQVVGQWHHRPQEALASDRHPQVSGPPPLILHLSGGQGRHVLTLLGRAARNAEPRTLGVRPMREGAWSDLVFHIRWSTGSDGFVEAWLDGRPFTAGKVYGRTLYSPASNYLRLGLYRGKGFTTRNQVYYDEVRIGDSYQAVAP